MQHQTEYKFPSHLDNLLSREYEKTDRPDRYIQQRVPMTSYMAETVAELAGFKQYH
ncbi:hypothetical protein [Bradyrhizobium erythrophlei]|uniref:Uncharacterized protein n=1 Tax=Bradyrhizobium erythrophlei TaxID=1437360 RepID=A0A1M5TA25_9BRAD|nr:hypothetical protein [Bradyrhizobium erythrophlei]SHH47564.1 hypothetical protein SAMN05444169_7639 [Bradyrhizobium erythrophlei]